MSFAGILHTWVFARSLSYSRVLNNRGLTDDSLQCGFVSFPSSWLGNAYPQALLDGVTPSGTWL